MAVLGDTLYVSDVTAVRRGWCDLASWRERRLDLLSVSGRIEPVRAVTGATALHIKYAPMNRVPFLLLLFTLGCNREQPKPQAAAPPASSQPDARQLITQYGCNVCHVIPGVEGPQGSLGPSLAGVASRPTLSEGTVQNTPANLAQFIREPGSLNPQTSMPPIAMTDAEAETVATYLLTLE
jgi:cytochrome c